jgi:hypothetical protein
MRVPDILPPPRGRGYFPTYRPRCFWKYQLKLVYSISGPLILFWSCIWFRC